MLKWKFGKILISSKLNIWRSLVNKADKLVPAFIWNRSYLFYCIIYPPHPLDHLGAAVLKPSILCSLLMPSRQLSYRSPNSHDVTYCCRYSYGISSRSIPESICRLWVVTPIKPREEVITVTPRFCFFRVYVERCDQSDVPHSQKDNPLDVSWLPELYCVFFSICWIQMNVTLISCTH